MTVKGCRREAVVMFCEGDDIFDEVHFILKPDKTLICDTGRGDIISRANRIIDESRRSAAQKPAKRKSRLSAALFGFMTGFICAALMALIIVL